MPPPRAVILGRVDLRAPDAAFAAPDEVRAAVDAVAATGAGAVTVDVSGFVPHVGFAYLEAQRLRGADAGVEVTCASAPAPGYDRPFHEIIGFGGSTGGSPTTVPLRRFGPGDEVAVLAFLDREWGSRAERLSSVAVGTVVEAVGEFFHNGLTHARSPIGVVSCGQYYAQKRALHLSIVDAGIGIPRSIAESAGRREEHIDPARALHWAFERGHSTRTTASGQGLANVRDFVARTGATLHVVSGSGYAMLRGEAWSARRLNAHVAGTVIDLEVPTASL